MKRILTNLIAVSGIGLLLLSSCQKSGILVKSNGGKAGTLTASVTTLPLNKAMVNDTTSVINFSFSKANYGYSAVITNTLQIDVPGDNWANPSSVTLGSGVYSQSYSTQVFNNLVLKLNVPAGVATPIVARIEHSISATVAPVYSNTINLTVTAFNLTSWLYVVGAFENWSVPSAGVDSLISPTGNGIYTGIINFPAGDNQFLILPQSNSYNNKYATTQAAGTTTTVSIGANNNLTAPTAAGQYLITLNINNNTISIVPADYYSVIGDAAQGWSTDLGMKFINDGNNNWVLKLPLVSTGSFKIRQDDAWSESWGVPQSGSAGYGVPNTLNSTSNNNISVAASGTYTVSFNAPPSVMGGTTPALVTTTYSVTQ